MLCVAVMVCDSAHTRCCGSIESAPRVLKLYANRTNLGFSDAGDIEPTQTIELAESDLGRDIELRFVKFQRVQSITVRRSLSS